MWASLFIVWRESVEALLVIGILYAWLKHNDDGRAGYRYLWAGAAGGLVVAGFLAVILYEARDILGSSGGEWLQIVMVFVAAALILQMVTWMHHHGREMAGQLRSSAERSMAWGRGWGIFLLALIAVAREGSETVVFLFGVGAQQQGQGLALFALGGIIGLVLAILTFWLLQLGAIHLTWQWFFRISEIILLLLAGGLVMTGTDRIIAFMSGADLPEWLYAFSGDAVWDTRFLLDDSGGPGGFIASMTGYRAMPSWMSIAVFAIYWVIAVLLLRPRQRAVDAVHPKTV